MPDYAARRTTMVDTQVRPSDVTKFPIIAAFLEVPRERYVPAALREAAYAGELLAIAPGRALLDPRSFAKMLDAMDLGPDELVLDVGAGLGYGAAIMARLAGTVVALEEDAAMAAEAEAMLAAERVDTAIVIAGRLADGGARHGPYDAIVIEGGVEQIPDQLVAQLKDGGRMAAIFMQGPVGTCRIGLKHAGAMRWRDDFNATAPVLPGFASQKVFVL
jgi:protein-L-isoaspartate(D-aspartate) O-methyltransferase